MEIPQIDILLRLTIAHLLADFIFQTDSMVKSKRAYGIRSRQFYLHLAIVGLTTYVLLADWLNWWAPIVVMLLHGLIDWAKIKFNRDTVWAYMGDQLLHLLSLVFIWAMLTHHSPSELIQLVETYEWINSFWITCMAYLLLTLPSGVLIAYLTKTWHVELETDRKDSLSNAGKWIGIIERILILTFILINEWAPIGFLLAAKSVFRFGDLKEGKDHKKTEYILIGTLLSFTFAIFLGLFVHFFLDNNP